MLNSTEDWVLVSTEPAYCKRGRSLKILALRMHKALILEQKQNTHLHASMFKNKTKSLLEFPRVNCRNFQKTVSFTMCRQFFKVAFA